MMEVPRAAGQAQPDVREVGADPLRTQLDRLIEEVIGRHAAPAAPTSREVRSQSHQMHGGLGSADAQVRRCGVSGGLVHPA